LVSILIVMTDQANPPSAQAPLSDSATATPVRIAPSGAAPRADLDFLSPDEQAKLQRLTAQSDARYEADAQNQQVLERFKSLMRTLFMRLDQDGKYRPHKLKLLGYAIFGAMVLSFWSYWPKPDFGEAAKTAGISLPIGSASAAPSSEAATVTSPPEEAPPEPSITPPVTVPTAQLEPPPADPAIQQGSTVPAASAGAYDPYERAAAPSSSAPASDVLSSSPNPSYASAYSGVANPSGARTGYDGLESGFPVRASTAHPSAQKPAAKRLPEPQALVKATPRSYPAPQALVNRERSATSEPAAIDGTMRTPSEPLAVNGTIGARGTAPEPLTAREMQGGGAAAPQAGVLVDRSTTANPSSAEPFGVQTQGRTAAAPTPGVLIDTSRSTTPTGTPSSVEAQAAPSPYPPGTRLAAKLVTGLVAMGGRAMPFAAQLEDGTIAFGQAQLTESLRVQLTVLELYKDKTSYAANATGLDAAGFAGLTGTVRREGPDVVGQLFDASLRGLNGYIQGQASGTSTATVAGSITTVSQQGPSLGWSVLGSLAQAFLPCGQAPQQQTITFVELKADTPFFVLFMPK
jgi:hypothetical protein